MNIFNCRFLSIFIFLFSLTSSITLYAQTDYVITNDGVKVMGEVKSHNVDKVKFIPDGEKKTKKYKPEDIKEAYKAGHGIFCSLILPGDKKASFLQLLDKGKIELYEFFKNGYTTMYGTPMSNGPSPGPFVGVRSNPVRYWYARKEGGDLVEIKTNMIWGSRKDRKDNFSALIKDNDHVLNRYQTKDKFTFDFIQSLIVEYNGSPAK